MAPSRRPSRVTQAFTLIELLVVIAIIAILTAILLPVFNSVREGSRQGVAISNMRDIQQKMEQFKLDNHKYPDVLFGYVYRQGGLPTGTVVPMTQALAQVTADHQADLNANVTNPVTLASHNPSYYFPGLYPAYIKDPNEFTDPNNPTDVNAPPAKQATGALTVNLVAPCYDVADGVLNGTGTSNCTVTPTTPAAGQVLTTTRTFYTLDAYDSGPKVLGGNKVDLTGPFYPRYQLAREGTVCPVGVTPQPGYCDNTVATNDPDYKRQLRWQNPPADTVITMTSYHVQNADKVLIMFQSGAVQKVKAEDFVPKEGVNTFWRFKQP
jgi:prepilin-type N-terminal cleavage/methylation domain-containing protein